MLAGLLLTLGLLPAAEAPQEPDKGMAALRGKWELTTVIVGPSLVNTPNVFCTFGDGKLAWTLRLPKISKEAGEGKFTVDTSRTPSTFELQVGDKVYRGIYRFRPTKDGKGEYLDLLFAAEGEPLPKAFGETEYVLPEGFNGFMLKAYRPK